MGFCDDYYDFSGSIKKVNFLIISMYKDIKQSPYIMKLFSEPL
jgi:hypothetical protein